MGHSLVVRDIWLHPDSLEIQEEIGLLSEDDHSSVIKISDEKRDDFTSEETSEKETLSTCWEEPNIFILWSEQSF